MVVVAVVEVAIAAGSKIEVAVAVCVFVTITVAQHRCISCRMGEGGKRRGRLCLCWRHWCICLQLGVK